MSRITGIIEIDFETDKDITKEQFKMFKAKLGGFTMDEIEVIIENLAAEKGFEVNQIHPAILQYLDCEI